MNVPIELRRRIAGVALAASALVPGVTAAQSTPNWDTGKWQFSAVIYGYLPKIDGSMAFSTASGSPSINVDASTIIDNLKFTAMGSFDAPKGRWGFFTDVLYLDVGGSQSQTRDFALGRAGIPASVKRTSISTSREWSGRWPENTGLRQTHRGRWMFSPERGISASSRRSRGDSTVTYSATL